MSSIGDPTLENKANVSSVEDLEKLVELASEIAGRLSYLSGEKRQISFRMTVLVIFIYSFAAISAYYLKNESFVAQILGMTETSLRMFALLTSLLAIGSFSIIATMLFHRRQEVTRRTALESKVLNRLLVLISEIKNQFFSYETDPIKLALLETKLTRLSFFEEKGFK